MRLARFNENGIRHFREFLDVSRQGLQTNSPLELLANSDLIEEIPAPAPVDIPQLETRRELAEFVEKLLSAAEIDDDMSDIGLWAWLSAALFDSICPMNSNGKRSPGKDYRYIPSQDWRDFYRHLVRGPVRILRLFNSDPDAASIVLCQRPSTPGDFVEQLASRQERITNPAIIAAANLLYFDSDRNKPKVGASPNWRKPGSLRRFGDILDQLDLTFDLYSMSASDLLTLLPVEFSSYAK